MAAGAMLVILCALGTYWLTQRSAERAAVVGVAHDVPWGQVVTSADLVQVEAVEDPALRPVPWSDVSSLVGQHAAADLQAGSLVTARSVTSAQVPGPGEALVGVSVKQAQMPVTTLHPGDSTKRQSWLGVARKGVTDAATPQRLSSVTRACTAVGERL